MVHQEKYGQGTHEKAHQEKDKDKEKAPAHQGPPGEQSPSEQLGGTGSPTSGPSGEPMVKPPEQPPGQPKEGEESAAGEVGETDIGGAAAQQEDTSKKK